MPTGKHRSLQSPVSRPRPPPPLLQSFDDLPLHSIRPSRVRVHHTPRHADIRPSPGKQRARQVHIHSCPNGFPGLCLTPRWSRPGQPGVTFGAILVLAGRAAHLEAVRRMLSRSESGPLPTTQRGPKLVSRGHAKAPLHSPITRNNSKMGAVTTEDNLIRPRTWHR